MSLESPEAVLEYILLNVHGMPQPFQGESHFSDDHKRWVQMWFSGHLAADFHYSDLFDIERILRDEERSGNPLEIPPALLVGDDAYIYMHDSLISLIRENGVWKLRIALSMCWGCFGNHSFPGGQCWGVLCQCCGGTGWEGGNLEFCVGHATSKEPVKSVKARSPGEAFASLQRSHISTLEPLRNQEVKCITPALVRGQTAKIEITTSVTRYFALLRQLSQEEWQLSAFLPLCKMCGGEGHDPSDYAMPCSSCGGLKWGLAGELRYCRHTTSDWWMLV